MANVKKVNGRLRLEQIVKRAQEQLIKKLAKDFLDVKELLEYEDYVQSPTKANASSLITLALEEYWKQVQQMDGCMKYTATRPRAERLGDHGLFGDADHIDLNTAMSELEQYTGNVWTHIISLHRKDAERLGYENAQAWRALLHAHRNDIATAMHIPPQDFRWYAAFHDKGDVCERRRRKQRVKRGGSRAIGGPQRSGPGNGNAATGSIRKRKDGWWEGFYTASYDPETGKQEINRRLRMYWRKSRQKSRKN